MDKDKPSTKGLGKTYGESGTMIDGGIIRSEEYNMTLTGTRGNRIYDQMRRSDAAVHATLEMCKLPIEGLSWNITPASDDEFDQYVSRFIDNQLFHANLNWHDFTHQSLGMFDFGFSVAEKTYSLGEFEGKIRVVIDSIGFRKQLSIYKWEMPEGQPGVTQQLTTKTVGIPRSKLMVFSNQREGDNYEGVPLLRYAYKDWYMKDKLIKINAVSLEKQGAGVPIITFGDNVTPTEKERARNIMRQFRANEEAYLEIPKDSGVEMMDMKGSSTKEILPSIRYHDQQITLSVLGQFLMLGSTETGSRAVGDVHSRLFLQSEEAAAVNFQTVVQNELIRQLCDLNFSSLPNGYPKLTHSRLETDDISIFSKAIADLTNAGMITKNAETEQHIRSVTHLPALSKDEVDNYDELNPPTPSGPTDPGTIPDPSAQKNLDNKTKEATKAAALRRARASRKQLIDVITGA